MAGLFIGIDQRARTVLVHFTGGVKTPGVHGQHQAFALCIARTGGMRANFDVEDGRHLGLDDVAISEVRLLEDLRARGEEVGAASALTVSDPPSS